MTTTIETHSAQDARIGWSSPLSDVGEDTLLPGQYAITMETDSMAAFIGTPVELARLISRMDYCLSQINTHEALAKEPEAELPPELVAAKAQGLELLTTDQMREQYEVLGFLAPFVTVRRKSDGQRGSLQFSHAPRFYFGFVAES